MLGEVWCLDYDVCHFVRGNSPRLFDFCREGVEIFLSTLDVLTSLGKIPRNVAGSEPPLSKLHPGKFVQELY